MNVKLTPYSLVLLATLFAGHRAAAQQVASTVVSDARAGGSGAADAAAAIPAVAADDELPDILGPSAPDAPDMVRRDAKGNATIRAVRIARPLRMDGRLDDEIYQTVPAVSDFVQQLPRDNVPATDATAVWVFFDDENLYISARCDSAEPGREVATELRRDHNNVLQGDNFTVVFDTFYDRRNGFFFQTNPLGAVRDQAISEGAQIVSWNTVWDVRTARTPQGWTVEMVIPFKSLRYRQPGPQIWGINFRRIVKAKNEVSLLTALPKSYAVSGVSQMASAGTLVGLETPGRSMNLELKPYVVSTLTTDQTASKPFSNDFGRNIGTDFKYGLTPSLIADVTINTDFAQVEEDLQQVNLTRFSLFFPEKRDFFLENQGTFAFGDRARVGAGGDVPLLFFSRQIGLSKGQSVPVVLGGRVTGKAGAFDIGVLNIQTADKDEADAFATNFSVLRVKRDIFSRSSIGLIATRRTPTSGGGSASSAGGFDASLRLSNEATATGYYARTSVPGKAGDESSYRGRFDYNGDRYGLGLEHMMVGDDFSPTIGYVRRPDFRRTNASVRVSRRTTSSRLVRRLSGQTSLNYTTDAKSTRLEDRTLSGNFDIEFHSSDAASLDYVRDYELLPDDFRIATGIVVPAGGYSTDTVRAGYTLGQQRKVSGNLSASWGTFYKGTRVESAYGGRIGLGPQFAIEPSISLNWVNLPYGDFTTRLITSRFIVTPTPRLVVTGLVQFNASSHTVSSSARLRWEYIPGSELFVVYSDGRDTMAGGIGLLNRSIAIKATRLLRF